jgi:predicted RNA binding protein YcfA (HicA-like mRNA interferase family)
LRLLPVWCWRLSFSGGITLAILLHPYRSELKWARQREAAHQHYQRQLRDLDREIRKEADMVKLRELRSELRQLGFVPRQGKGSHEVWTDPQRPRRNVVLSGAGGEDAKPFQISKVRRFRRGMMVYDEQQ